MSVDTATLITTFCPVSLSPPSLCRVKRYSNPTSRAGPVWSPNKDEKVEFAAATCLLGRDRPSPGPPALCPRSAKETPPQPAANPENYNLLKLCDPAGDGDTCDTLVRSGYKVW